MFIRIAFFVLMALGLVGFGTVAWVTARPHNVVAEAAQAKAAPKAMVLVAAHPLPIGSLLKPEDMVGKELANGSAIVGSSTDTPEVRRQIAGAMIRRALGAGEPITNDDIMRPGDHGFLSAVLAPGKRAVTIAVDATSGLSGLIWPGDHVDLILTQATTDPALSAGHRVGAETVLSDVRVIAIDHQLMQGAAPTAADGQARTVTLEVDQDQAQRVSVATRLGHLSLSVRSSNGTQQANQGNAPHGPTWARDVLPSLLTEATPPVDNKIRVFQGAGDVREFKF